MADSTNIRQPGKEPVPILSGQQRPQLFAFDKVFNNNVQAPAVGRLWGHHLKSHLAGHKNKRNKWVKTEIWIESLETHKSWNEYILANENIVLESGGPWYD